MDSTPYTHTTSPIVPKWLAWRNIIRINLLSIPFPNSTSPVSSLPRLSGHSYHSELFNLLSQIHSLPLLSSLLYFLCFYLPKPWCAFISLNLYYLLYLNADLSLGSLIWVLQLPVSPHLNSHTLIHQECSGRSPVWAALQGKGAHTYISQASLSLPSVPHPVRNWIEFNTNRK